MAAGGSASATQGPVSDRWLGPVLIDAGVVSADQAGELASAPAGAVWREAVARGLATDQQILDVLSKRFKVAIADLAGVDARVAAFLPETIARRYQVVAIAADDRTIRIATADPRDLNVEQTLAFVAGRNVAFLAGTPAAIAEKIEEVYRPEAAINRLVAGLDEAAIETIDETPLSAMGRDPSIEAPMARLVDAMIADGVRERASDIHCEPLAEVTSVRYRIDGVLKEVMRLPASAGPALVRRVKIIARLDVTDPLHPHDGRAAVRVDGKVIDLRVSTVPVARRGEKVVIRILDKANLRASIPDLKLPPAEETALQRLLGFRDGILLVTGPTGSGKTTTLYAALNQLKTGKVNIVTVEDPVEYDIPGISQLQVSEASGFTFATALRSVLRQDPDIVLVGEIRDGETATIATQASLSGHLVLSTLHTNDAPSAIVRLKDLGIDGYKIASALKGVVAQRLVRRVCPECSVPISVESLPPEARPPAERRAAAAPRQAGPGCKACGGSGYRGRLGIYELMPVDERVARVIAENGAPDVLVAVARAAGLTTLWESGMTRVWLGDTTMDEVVRALGEHHNEDSAAAVTTAPIEGGAAVLPAPAPAAPPAANDPGIAPGPTRVLVVDDDRQMRRLIRMIVEREGHTVTEAADGLDALDMIESNQFDLMVLDLEMPRLDGFGVLEELRARVLTSSMPVIVLTSHGSDSEARVLDLGAQDFVSKPVQPQSLQARVRAVLRRTQLA